MVIYVDILFPLPDVEHLEENGIKTYWNIISLYARYCTCNCFTYITYLILINTLPGIHHQFHFTEKKIVQKAK